MAPRKENRYSLPGFLERIWPTCRRLPLCLFLGALSVSLDGQQVRSLPSQASSNSVVFQGQRGNADDSDADQPPKREVNPSMVLQPGWLFSTDSDSNIRQWLKMESSLAAGRHDRVGLLLGEGFISNSILKGSPEEIRDAGLTGQWHPSRLLNLEGMIGVSQAGSTTRADGLPVGLAFIPIAKVQAHLTPATETFKLDLGFERSIFDLSSQLVANRVVRNQFVIHPELAFANGWRMRALAEMGPMTRPGKSNARYNSEFTIGHKVGNKSQLYSTYGLLHYAHAEDAGYFSPDLVHNLQGGWTSDIDRGAFSLSLDLALGADRAKEHGTGFAPWGVSGGAGSFFTWTMGESRELDASYEYYYDKSSPAVALSRPGAWHMGIFTVSFRWDITGQKRAHGAQLPVPPLQR
jgi:hypothetical protein